jgi:hypothetical protein
MAAPKVLDKRYLHKKRKHRLKRAKKYHRACRHRLLCFWIDDSVVVRKQRERRTQHLIGGKEEPIKLMFRHNNAFPTIMVKERR